MKSLLQGIAKVLVVTIASFCVLVQVSQVDHAVDGISDRGALTSVNK